MPNAAPPKVQAFVYPAELERLDGEVIIRFPDFPEGLTGLAGEPTEREILAIAEDALEEIILGRLARGEEVPLPSASGPANGELGVLLGPLTAARVASR